MNDKQRQINVDTCALSGILRYFQRIPSQNPNVPKSSGQNRSGAGAVYFLKVCRTPDKFSQLFKPEPSLVPASQAAVTSRTLTTATNPREAVQRNSSNPLVPSRFIDHRRGLTAFTSNDPTFSGNSAPLRGISFRTTKIERGNRIMKTFNTILNVILVAAIGILILNVMLANGVPTVAAWLITLVVQFAASAILVTIDQAAGIR
jgi:hypothetical protein